MGGEDFTPYPINSGTISVDATGKIGDVTISFSNWDNIITSYVEDPFLVGVNKSNQISAYVNGELVTNIDPKTVPQNTSGNPQGLHYDATYATNRGGINLAYDYDSAIAVDGSWTLDKPDSRDLLGGVVEIKTTYANFLDVWPEYSTVDTLGVVGDNINLKSTLPYRIGDEICASIDEGATKYTITAVNASNIVVGTVAGLSAAFPVNGNVYIYNTERDSESYSLDKFKIDSLSGLDEKAATFSLINWLQYFKLQLPKRKYFKNTCPWLYRGPECRYPINANDLPRPDIPGSNTFIISTEELLDDGNKANGFFTINNEPTNSLSLDVCAKNLQACTLRNNQVHFGGFPATGRNLPR